MKMHPPTESTIRALASANSFARGKAYYRDGAVSDLVLRGSTLTAAVEGSETAPYDVSITLRDDGVENATCSCPYELGGACKHVVAVLFKYLADPRSVSERRPLAELLKELGQEDLVALLVKRSASDPDLARWIEAEIATTKPEQADPKSGTGRARRTLVDSAPVREQARALLGGRSRKRRYWDDYEPSGNAEELQRLVEKAVPFLEAGDGRNALRVLEPIAEELVDDWLTHSFGADETMYELFSDLGRLMAEAALMSDIDTDDRSALAETIEDWEDRLSDYGVDEGFGVAVQALKSGWDDPALLAVLAGQANKWPPPGSGQGDWYDEQLTAVRLRVLDACGRTQEYLHLAKAARARTSYAGMLVKLDRTPEAMKYALRSFKQPNEALDLARVLRARNAHDDALKIAKAGLALAGDDDRDEGRSVVPLAHWFRDYAGAMGKTDLALTAARAAFEHSLSLEDFRAVETRSRAGGTGERWNEIRASLLSHLARATYARDKIEIYLVEGMIDDAVHSVGEGRGANPHSEVLMQLAEAAHGSHADWVMRLSERMAASIMDANQAGHYALAARWLEKAALAYEADGREDEWAGRVAALIEKHRRKYKLRPLLESLRGAPAHAPR